MEMFEIGIYKFGSWRCKGENSDVYVVAGLRRIVLEGVLIVEEKCL
jgi:hypothetical protein